MIIAYDGTHYSGWQLQPNVVSIQEVLEEKLQHLLKQKIRIIGAGRTDANVHAIGQAAHFSAEIPLSLYRFQHALNSLLPKDIRIKHIENVPETFHAQYSALAKEYHYHLWLEKTHDPFSYLYSYKPKGTLNLSLLKEAIPYFLGTRDFTSFSNKGTLVKNRERTLYRIDCVEERGGIRLEFEGDGFLYKMVRNITGALILVGLEKLDKEEIPKIFKSMNRQAAPMSAPPQALFLVKVTYPEAEPSVVKKDRSEKAVVMKIGFY